MMKKKLVSLCLVFTLAVFLISGCSKGSPGISPAATVNPSAANPNPTGASPALPGSSPGVTPGATGDIFSALQTNIPLTITYPTDGADISTDTVAVKGQTVPGAIVSVNDATVTADAGGNFSLTISLDQGPNAIDVIATDVSGQEGEILIMVNGTSSGTARVASPTDSTGTIPLTVTQPADGATISANTVLVKGQTAPGATVIINDETIEADAGGNFSLNEALEAGPNIIDVTAVDGEGNQSEVILMVDSAL